MLLLFQSGDVNFGAIDLKEFILFLQKLIKRSHDNVYYYTRNESLEEGIRRVRNDDDYFECIEISYSAEDGLRMSVYINHENEPILDWVDMEVVEDDEGHDYEEEKDGDNDSRLYDDMLYDYEADDKAPSLDMTVGDDVLHKVSGICRDTDDEVDTNNGDEKPVFLVHNENQKWDKMVPILECTEEVPEVQEEVQLEDHVERVQV
ncbi:unnamed protein product [Lactuca virosa]|uniref:Uncharacterized protein n=1 Tax=Lactuca virosa TaxID=75947 RepID=A0AAU9PGT4_9ASTR|nr:unnamed protein product [Lactuca virosa]